MTVFRANPASRSGRNVRAVRLAGGLLSLCLLAMLTATAAAQTGAAPNPAPANPAANPAPAAAPAAAVTLAPAPPALPGAAPVLPLSSAAPLPATPAPAAPTAAREASFIPPDDAAPVIATPPAPSSPSAATPAPAPPALIAKPVDSAPLDTIDPNSVGLLTQADGGLGAAMWKGSSRALIEKLLPMLNLPTASAALNRLAQKLLLSIAAPPDGGKTTSESGKTAPDGAAMPMQLTAMRIDRLVALGDVGDAWKLAIAAKPERLDALTLQRVAANALLDGQGDAVCARLPAIMASDANPEWQKVLLVCQLRAKDIKAAQVTIDLLHAQTGKDEIFMTLVDKNLLAGNKILPRQLTPLRPLNMALLQRIDLPLNSELYAHPDAALIPALLQARAKDDTARLNLAERAAARSLIDSAALAEIYRSVAFSPEQLAAAAASAETGARLRAVLMQAALQEKTPQRQMDDAVKFMQSANPALLIATAPLLATMIGAAKPGPDYYPYAAPVAEIFMLANQPDAAQQWLALAKRGAIGMPGVAAALQAIWPVRVFSGFEADADYAADLKAWLDGMLQTAAAPGASPAPDAAKATRNQAALLLTLLEAMGFNVPDEAWAQVVDAPVFDKKPMPPVWLIERLRGAAAAGRRGEMVLLGLLLNNSGAPDPSRLATIAIIRALRGNGLTADAAALANETALDLLQAAAP